MSKKLLIMEIEFVLARCTVTRLNSDILVMCENITDFNQIVKNENQFIQLLTSRLNSDWQKIILRSKEGKKQTIFYPNPRINPFMQRDKQAMTNKDILKMSEADLIAEIMKYPKPSSLVRMKDDKGIFTNSLVRQSSGISPNNWIGKQMSNYWIEEELERYKRLLLLEKKLINFEYSAFFFTGQAANFTVESRLINFNGDLCRWVRVVECVLI